MKKILLSLAVLMLAPLASLAQTTSVSGTISDANSQAFANGTWSANLISVSGNGYTGPYYVGGVQLTQAQVSLSGTLNSSGAFTATLSTNSYVSPVSTLWRFTFCPAATSPCWSQSLTIVGSSQSISSSITPPAITVLPTGFAAAYADSEIVNPASGSTYFNLTSAAARIYVSGAWQNLGGSGGSGTVTSFSAGNLSPIFTTSVATSTTTPALTFSLSTAAADTVLGNCTGSTAAPSYCSIVAAMLPSTVVLTNQANTYSSGLQSFASVTLSLPSSAAYAPTTAGLFGYDSTNNRIVAGNGTNTNFLTWITAAPTTGHCAQFSGTLGLLADSGNACSGGTPTFPQTVAGTVTSGGVPYFNSTTQESSSALLAANALVVGGGTAGAPATGNGDFTYATHTLTGGASAILDMSAASTTAGFKIPAAAGAVPTADDFIAMNTTTHALVHGSNGTTIVDAAAATGTNTATTCTNQYVTVISSIAAPTCTTLAYPLTVSGLTSGGIPYASSTTVLTSSALLASNGLVLGGGAGAAPKTAAGLATDGTSKLDLGVAGTSVGSVVLANATSGTITISPVAGALGAVTISVPAITDTLVTLTATQTLTNKTLTAPNVGAATGTSLIVTGVVDGEAPVTITTGTTATLGAGTYQSGYTLNQEGTAGTGVTYTLPPTAKGMGYCVANSGTTSVVNTGVLTVYPASGSYVILNGVVNTVGGGGTHGVASGGAAGDAACFVAIDATHWQIWVGKGTWTLN